MYARQLRYTNLDDATKSNKQQQQLAHFRITCKLGRSKHLEPPQQ